ncbi:MAG: hypothetical protein AAF478_03625 [Pseudomonadota bacterium]
MKNKTTAQAMIVERVPQDEPVPDSVRTEEDFLKWRLYIIQRRYRNEAQPLLDRLAQIEASKPPKPITVPLDHWPSEFIRPLDESN